MFNPEFRYLLVQEEVDGVFQPLFDNNNFCELLWSNFIAGLFGIGIWIFWKFLVELLWIINLGFQLFWNTLAPRVQWIEKLCILVSVVGLSFVIYYIYKLTDILVIIIPNLKNDIKDHQKKIEELEKKLRMMEEKQL
jgi:hypothetical protein